MFHTGALTIAHILTERKEHVAHHGHLDPVLHHLGPVCVLLVLSPRQVVMTQVMTFLNSENVIKRGCQMFFPILSS
jgi:hypothetical protein